MEEELALGASVYIGDPSHTGISTPITGNLSQGVAFDSAKLQKQLDKLEAERQKLRYQFAFDVLKSLISNPANAEVDEDTLTTKALVLADQLMNKLYKTAEVTKKLKS